MPETSSAVLSAPASALCAALLALLVLALSARVSQLRLKHAVTLGDGGVKPLELAIRAHANTLEFAPLFVVMLLILELTAGTTPFAWVIGLVFVAGRAMFAAGMLSRALTRRRQLGALVTYLSYFALPAALLLTLI